MTSNKKRSIGSPSNFSWDLFFVIGAPAIAFFLVTMVSQPRHIGGHFLYDPTTPEWFIIMAALMTHFHVLMVFVRSHGNKQIFKRHPFRFIAVPIFGLIAISISPILASVMVVVALYWDEWHTQMQTFGFARIFDVRAGNNPNVGRKLDIIMVIVLGLFPQMVLLTYLPKHVRTTGLHTYLSINESWANQYSHLLVNLRYPLILFAIGFSVFYIYKYRKLVKNGHKISRKKLALMATTAISTLFIAMFYSLADSFYFFNIYHSLQYIYLVFFSETAQVADRFGTKKIRKDLMVFLAGLIIFVVMLLLSVARDMTTVGFFVNLWLMSSLLHFWYDGFIWSVRRQEV